MDYHLLQRLKDRSGNFDKIPEDIKKMSVIFFVYLFGVKGISFFIPVYINEVIDSYGLAGLIVSLFGIGMVFLDIPIGEMLDKVGRKTLLYLGLIFRTISGVLYAFAFGVPLLILARVSDGLGVSFSWDSAWTLARDKSPEGLESESLAIFTIGTILASIVSPIFIGFLAMRTGLRVLFYFMTASSFITLILAYFFIKDGFEKKEKIKDGIKDIVKKDKLMKKSFKDVKKLGKRGLVPLFLALFYSINLSIIWFIVPLFARALNADYFLTGLLFGVMYIPGLLRYWFSELSDFFGDARVIYYFSLAGVIFAIPLIFIKSIWLLFILVVAFMTIMQGQNPSLGALLTKVSPKEEMGELTGVFQTFKHIGFFLGPFLAGAIAEFFWISAPFALSAFILILMALVAKSTGFDM